MAKITAKKVIYNVKQKYVEATGDTSKITYGNIDDKVGTLVSPPQGVVAISRNGVVDVSDYANADVTVPDIITTGTIATVAKTQSTLEVFSTNTIAEVV